MEKRVKTPRPYKNEGLYFSELRKRAGIQSRTAFLIEARAMLGEVFNYLEITKLENGYVAPKALHLVVYAKVTGATLDDVLALPCSCLAPSRQKRL